eukprot:g20163.t1
MVCCKTPAILLEEAHMMPKEVDVLAIDAEGLDEQILKSFLKLPGFDPLMIFCEVTHMDSMKVPIDGQAEEKAKTAVQEMDRQIQALRTVQVPPSRDHAGQNDLHARLAGVQR